MGGFFIGFIIKANIHHSSPTHENGKRAQINKPMAGVSLG